MSTDTIPKDDPAQDADGSFEGVFPEDGGGDDPGQQTIIPEDTESGETQSPEPADTGDSTPAGPAGTLLDRLREAGYEGDEEDVVQGIVGTRNLAQQMQQQFQQMQMQNAQLIDRLTQQQPAQNQPTPPAQTQEPESPWKSVQPLQLTEAYLQQFRTEDGGWADNTPPQVFEELERYQTQYRDFYSSFAQDPRGFLENGVREILRQEMQQVFGVEPEQFREQYNPEVVGQRTQMQTEWQEAIPVLYTRNPVSNQFDNFSQLTQLGQQFMQAMQESERYIESHYGKDKVNDNSVYSETMRVMRPLIEQAKAQQQGGGNGNSAPPTGPPSAAQAREEQRRSHMRKTRASGAPTAGGTGEGGNPGQPRRTAGQQNPLMNIGSEFSKELANAGFFSR